MYVDHMLPLWSKPISNRVAWPGTPHRLLGWPASTLAVVTSLVVGIHGYRIVKGLHPLPPTVLPECSPVDERLWQQARGYGESLG